MRRLCYIIIILVAILLVPLEARLSSNVFVPYQHDSPSFHLQKLWAEHMQKSCSKELAEMKKELGGCDLYLSFKASTIWLKPTSHETLTTLQSKLQQHVLDCARKHYNRFPGHATRPKLLLHLSKPPRRYLADSSHKASASKAASPAPDIFDDPIIIPPNLLFPSPPPSSGDSPNAGAANNDQMNKIITVAVSVLGILVIFALCLFCCLRKGRGGYAYTPKDDKPLLTLSTSSSTGSNAKDVGRNDNTGFNHSTPNLEVLGGALPGIPEHDSDVSANSEELSSEQHNTGKSNTPPAAAAPPPPPPPKPKPAPPPPPKGVRPPPAPPRAGAKGRSASADSGDASDPDSSRTKLKPFFWDKVVGSPDHSMVWDEIRSGSFQFNEEMIESLFGYNPDDKKNAKRKNGPNDAPQSQYIQIIDAKKSQNLSILLKALNVTTEEVRDSLLEGNELPAELLQTLLRMAPTQEEELKLRLFTGDIAQLGPADKFLKVLVDIPFAFKRMESLSFMMTFKDEVSNIKESFVTLEVACDELKKSRLFLKLLEAVLKTGNRMNDGTYRGGAQAFKLDTLLKLADVKGTDGKTTLLHFVVQEIIRSEGLKALRAAKDNRSISSMKTEDFVEDQTYDASEQHRILGLEIVSGISSELENVKKAAIIDGDILASTVTKLGQSLQKLKTFLDNEMSESQDENGFHEAVVSFVQHSESQVTWLLEEEKRISSLVRKTADYFHGNSGREEGLRLFSIVRDFMHMLDKICTELKQSIVKKANRSSRESSSVNRPSLDQNSSIQDMRQKLFPAIADRRVGDSTSDSDND